MVRITFWLKLLLLVLILRQLDAVSDHCNELQNEISRLEGHIIKRINDLEYRNDILEHLKIETHVPEAFFRSLKFEEYEFKSKLQQSDGVISSFKKQLERNGEVLQSYNTKQVQQHTAIAGSTETVELLNRTANVLCEKQKQLQVTIDGLTKTEETNNRTIQELRVNQKQLQGTIDGLTKTEETNNRTIQELRVNQKQLQGTIDGLTKTEETNNQTIQELRVNQKQLQGTIDGLTRTVEALNHTVKLLCGQPSNVCRYLFEAAKSGDVNTAKNFFECNNDTCTTDDEKRDTPLIYAAEKGHVELVRVLLESGANLERANADQRTALLLAVFYGHLDVCRLLLDWGAKVNSVDRLKITPLMYAAASGRVEVVRVLLESGANVQKANNGKETALHAAATYGHLDVCRLLLDWGATVDPVDKLKETPLHEAARKGYLSVVKLLVERGADVRLRNVDGQTARDKAWSNTKPIVAEWLDSLTRG